MKKRPFRCRHCQLAREFANSSRPPIAFITLLLVGKVVTAVFPVLLSSEALLERPKQMSPATCSLLWTIVALTQHRLLADALTRLGAPALASKAAKPSGCRLELACCQLAQISCAAPAELPPTATRLVAGNAATRDDLLRELHI